MASLVELALIEGPFAAAYLLAVGAVAVGVIPVDPKRLRLARNCFLASAVIFAAVAVIWGINSHMGFLPRLVTVFLLSGLAGVAAVETARFLYEHGSANTTKTQGSASAPLERPQAAQPDLELGPPNAIYTLDWRPPFGLRIYIKKQGYEEESETYYNPVFLIKNNTPSTPANAVFVRCDLPLNFHPVAIRVPADVTPFGAVSVPA